jgi:hypothetical protein
MDVSSQPPAVLWYLVVVVLCVLVPRIFVSHLRASHAMMNSTYHSGLVAAAIDRALYPWTCGTHVDNSPAAQLAALAARAGLMAQASYLGIPPKLLARVPEQFELADLDRYDVIVAVDSEVRESVLEQVDPNYSSYYRCDCSTHTASHILQLCFGGPGMTQG